MGSRAQALAPELSPLLDVEADPRAEAKQTDRWSDTLACGPEQCLSVYVISARLDATQYSTAAIIALRLDHSGKWNGTAPTVLARSDTSSTWPMDVNWVVAQGNDFLVGITPPLDSSVGYVHRVSADGTAKLVAEGPQWVRRPLCVTNERAVFRWEGVVGVFSSNFSPLGSPVPISAAEGVVGSSTCLVYSPAAAVRLRLSDGAALDSPLIVPTKYEYWRVSGGYKAGNFVLFWQKEDKLFSFRLREADGVVLDPDDTFNQKPGAQLIATNVANGELKTFDWGNQLFVTWWQILDSKVAIVGARVDPTTGLRVSGTTSTYESFVGSEALGSPVYLTPSEGLLAWGGAGRSVSVQGSPPIFTPGVGRPVALQLPSRKHPAVAATPAQFVVAWDADGEVRATRLTAAGAYLDSPSLVVGTGSNPAAAAGQSGYLLTWLDGEYLGRRWLQVDGSLGPVLPPVDLGAAPNPVKTKLVFDGDRFVFSWQEANRLKAVRLDSSAALLDAAPLNIATGVNNYDVTADTTPPANRRSFAFSYRYVSGDDKARLLRSQSGVLVEPELKLGTPAQSDGSLAAAASDGTKIAMSFYPTSGSVMARGYLDPVAIAFEPSAFKDVGSARTGNLWFDGNSYLLLESRTSTGTLGVRRFAPTLAPVDSAKAGSGYVLESAFSPSAFWHVAAASDKAGTSLVAYPQLDPARLGGIIKVRLIVNDGLKDPNAAGGAGGQDAGGTGSSGTGGLSGGTGGTDVGTGGLSGGTGGISGGTGAGGISDGTGGISDGGDGGMGGVSAGGDSMGEGGVPQSGGSDGQTGGVASAGSSPGQGGGAPQSGAPGNGGRPPGTGGAAQGGAAAGSPQAGSGASGGIAGSSAGDTSGSNDPSTSNGCGCRVVAPSPPGLQWAGAMLTLLGFTVLRVRTRRAGRRGGEPST